jgi:Zn-dependent M28 family amino/carboxypeptidase
MRIRILLFSAVLIVVLIVLPIVLVSQPFVTPIPSQPPHVDSARLEIHVKHLSVDLYPRSYDRFRNLELAAQYIIDEFKAAGAAVTIQDVDVHGKKYKNIIAHFGPQSGPLMVIGAHYDSHGDADKGARYPRGYDLETHTPGADDNASGVAGLLELSRLLGRKPQTRSIELVAYTLEEPPYFDTEHMGSVWHAHSLAVAKRDVQLMVSLEMIGYFSDARGSQRFPFPAMAHLYSDRGNFIGVVGKFSDFNVTRKIKALMSGASDLPVYSINAPPLLEGIDFSDHRSYWNKDIPAFMVTDTAFFRNGNHHQPEDTYEKLDYQRMAKVVQAIYALTQGY